MPMVFPLSLPVDESAAGFQGLGIDFTAAAVAEAARPRYRNYNISEPVRTVNCGTWGRL